MIGNVLKVIKFIYLKKIYISLFFNVSINLVNNIKHKYYGRY